MNLWTQSFSRFCLGALLLGASAALAQAPVSLGSGAETAACCQLTTSLANDVIRPQDIPGDERFFMTEGAPPNIHFLFDTSCSMQELVHTKGSDHDAFFDQGDGCTNTSILAFQQARNWNPATVYPKPDLGTGLGADTGHPNLFLDNRYYAYMSWGDSSDPIPTWATKEAACGQQHPGDRDGSNADGDQDVQYGECLACLDTKGFYKKPGANHDNDSPWADSRFILWGRYLNFDPPRYVTAKAVMKSVIKDIKRVRAGMSEFDSGGAGMVREQNPPCDKIAANADAFDGANRSSYINAIDSLRFDEGTPLANALLNIGQYFSSDNTVYKNKFGFTDYTFRNKYTNGSLNGQSRSWCWGCQVSSVIIITDGEPSGTDTLPSTTFSRIKTLNGGDVGCPAGFPCSNAANYKLDDVAKFLANQDLQQTSPATVGDFNSAGKQSMSVYTIGFGLDSNLLRNTAEVGGGAYYTANDAKTLKDAILEIIRTVQTRATSFSTTSVASLQVNRAGGTLVPRFKPAKSATATWQGLLYRFSLAPEVLLGCVKNAAGTTNAKDLNQDGDCDDIHLIDSNGDAVIEDDEGNFVLVDDPLQPAVPFWEAGKKLKADPAAKTQRWKTRKIYTIVDNRGPNNGPKDGRIDRWDVPIPFDEAHAAELQEYLGISNNPLECSALATRLGLANLLPLECAKTVIRYYRGANVLSQDVTLRDYDRPYLLHDIFHSAPISVEPPTPKFFCGYANQCLDTLYTGNTDLKKDYPAPGGKKRDAYEEFLDKHGDRLKIVLVGSNGGMLHAFHNGTKIAKDEATGLYEYNAGTGDELWAFIPPDLLPRLRPKMGLHTYFVDGTAMVRDVWLDDVGGGDADDDNIKQAPEFRTVAVVGTGAGGVHRFALDLTNLLPSSKNGIGAPRPPDKQGDFLWMWPQPCDPLATQLGEAFTSYAPKPPPIGPVAMLEENKASNWIINGKKAREQWVVLFNGGYDPYQVRGRGLAMVDIATGNTLWSMFNGDNTADRPLADKMRYPFAAGVTMLDLGNAPSSVGDADLLFDTLVVPDFGGQVWLMRFWDPGKIGANGQVENWFAARSFHVATTATEKADDLQTRPVFSFVAANTVQPDTGYLRTYLGTGDRYHLVDVNTTCRLSNGRGCAYMGCGVKNNITVERNAVKTSNMSANYLATKYSSGSNVTTAGGSACMAPKVTLSWDTDPTAACGVDSAGKVEYSCSGTSLTWGCNTVSEWVNVHSLQAVPATSPNRFYGFWSYGVVNDASKNLVRTFNNKAQAQAFDAARFRDDDLTDVSQFSATGVVGAGEAQAPALGKGWYIKYGQPVERTGTGSTIIDGCVIWSSFEPSGAQSAVCSTTGTNAARTYQANFVTGKADCASSFVDASEKWVRYIKSSAVAAPPEPAPQRTLVNGKVYSSAVIPGVGGGGGGGNQQFIVGENKEVLQSVYQIEVDRATHECRHRGDASQCK
jgi:type IV pilus assembly protein PilY1